MLPELHRGVPERAFLLLTSEALAPGLRDELDKQELEVQQQRPQRQLEWVGTEGTAEQVEPELPTLAAELEQEQAKQIVVFA